MAKKKANIIYNDYDQNQVRAYLRKQKAKRRVRRLKMLGVLFVLALIAAYFVSDLSRFQKITVTGNEKVGTELIIQTANIKLHDNIILFTDLNKVEKKLEKTSLIKKATISKNILGKVVIKITEATPIGQCYVDGVLYVIDDRGVITRDEAGMFVSYVTRTPQLYGFDEARLKEFASSYASLPSQVINQVSDINYAPGNLDETRCEFIMDDGKVLYLRYDDMVEQLKGNNYSLIMEKQPDCKYYDFNGKHVYATQ